MTEFAPGGWKLPSEALGANLQSEQFSGFMNHSMIALESFIDNPSSASSRHGVASHGADACAEGGRQRQEATTPGGTSKGAASSTTVEALGGEAGRPHGVARSSSKGSKLASKFLVAALGFQAIAGGPVSFYPRRSFDPCQDQGLGHPAGVCGGDQVCGFPWSQAD